MEDDLYNPFTRKPSSTPIDDPIGEAGAPLSMLRLEWNLDALAAAALAPRSALAAAPPLLSWIGLTSRPARLADISSGWFSYWTRELALPAEPDQEAWRGASALQALYEAGLLRPGARLRLDAEGDRLLGAYLRGLSLCAVADGGEPLDGWLGAESTTPHASAFAKKARCVWIGDFSFAGTASDHAPSRAALEQRGAALVRAGWTVGDLSFDLGDHPLDRFTALPAEAENALGGPWSPRLRVAHPTALTTPYILIGDRPG